jgi:formylmethanofuran dehydrogenase subunit E
MIMAGGNPYRKEVEKLIAEENRAELLARAGELHGHYCNYLGYGVIAALDALKRFDVVNTGMEELVAIIETNNCFADGVQFVSGCSFGNNALIYRDYGKTAVTFCNREGRAVRYVLAPEFEDSRPEEYPEGYGLFDRLVARREAGEPGDYERMMQLFADMTVEDLDIAAESMFRITEGRIDVPSYAPIFDSVKCEKCGENVMKSRALEQGGVFYCVPCAEGEYGEVNGGGITQRN